MFRSSGLSSKRSRSSQREPQPEMRYFKEITTKVNITIQYGDGPNIFNKEQSLIIRDFQKELESHKNYPDNIQDFIMGVKKLAMKPQYFKKVLLPSELQQISESDSIIGMKQESVMRVFLSVDSIQSEIIQVILEEVATHAVNDNDDTTWIRLLLGPLRYLSYIKDVKKLTARLLEILEVATFPAQLEILNFIPEIIPDCEYDDVAKKLTKLLDENSDLTGAIVDCLNYLNLSADIKTEIQDHILALMQTTNTMKIFPAMFQFLVGDCKPQDLDNILIKTRSALDTIMISRCDDRENDSDQVLTFEEIKSLAVSSKSVADGWVNIISSIRVHSEHKPVDFLILLMLHSMGGNRKHVIESLVKRKIKSRILKHSLIEMTLKKYLAPETLKDYLNSILHIAGCLLQTQFNSLYIECAKTMYCTTFGNDHCNRQQRQQILNDLIFLTGSGNVKFNIPSLGILNEISEKHFSILLPHTVQLMNLLDKIEDLNLGEVKQVFYLLCGLICGPNATGDTNMLQNELHIIVRKQLSSSKRNIKYRGIIAAVAMAKNIAAVTNEAESSIGDNSFNSVSMLPQGNAKQAAMLLTLASTASANCPIARGLYYDQLGQMIISSQDLDKYFMAWIFDVVTNDFQNVYITEEKPKDLMDITLSVQYNLNREEEIDAPIFINISEMVIQPTDENNLILTMACLFRLLRLVHFKQSGSLQTIDALLGCGVVMPVIDPDIGIDNFDTQQSGKIADCLFHCINWLRELISAFVTQKGAKLQLKMLNRVNNLIELEEMLGCCMRSVPNHRLPPSYFYNVTNDRVAASPHSLANKTKVADKTKLDKTKSASKPPKAKRKKSDLNDTSKVTPPRSQAGRKTQPKEKDFNFNFREMDTDIILLLKYPLDIKDKEQNKLVLSLSQYKFIMNDLVCKFQVLLGQNKPNDLLLNLNLIKSDDLISDCVRLMPQINEHLTKILEEIDAALKQNDQIHDTHEMFQQPMVDLKISLSLSLEMLALLLSWTGFQNSKNLPLLRDCLRSLGTQSSTQLNSVQKLTGEFLKRITSFVDCCLTLSGAVNIIKILKALCVLTSDTGPKKKLVEVSGTMLSTKWYNLSGLPEIGAAANANIDILIKAHLNETNLSALSSVISWIQSEAGGLTSKNSSLTTYPSITKTNFPILYRGVCSALVEAVKNGIIGLTNSQYLEFWCNTAATMRALMDIVKIQESRTNLATYLKKMLGILKLFLSNGIPILEIMLKTKSDKVIEILRSIQQNTRFIQNLCCHSKVSKDMGLIAYVPQMRLTLETLIYRVKAMLVANKCATAFWMGNLKNKNLKGEEICTQASNVADEANEQSEDELPPDESENELEESKDESVVHESDDSNSELF